MRAGKGIVKIQNKCLCFYCPPFQTGDALATGVVAFIKNVDASKLNEQCNKKEVNNNCFLVQILTK